MSIENIFNQAMQRLKTTSATPANMPNKQEFLDTVLKQEGESFYTIDELLAQADNQFTDLNNITTRRALNLTPLDDKVSFLSPGNVDIYGKNGDDILTSVLGRDIGLFGDNGNDTLTLFHAQGIAGSRYNQINGGAGADRLELSFSEDSMAYGGDGDDTVYLGFNTDSSTTLGSGNDKLYAIGMQNTKRTDMFGGDGDDEATLYLGSHVGYFGGDGNDKTTIGSLTGKSTIQGQGGNNVYTFVDSMSDGLLIDGKQGFDSVDVSAYYGEDGHPKPGHTINFLKPYDGSGTFSFLLTSPGNKKVQLLDIETLIRNGEVIFPK